MKMVHLKAAASALNAFDSVVSVRLKPACSLDRCSATSRAAFSTYQHKRWSLGCADENV